MLLLLLLALAAARPLDKAAWGANDITTVHVVQGCHLDVGFADSAAGIINRWFTEHFPNAIKVADQLRKDTRNNARLMFTAQSYVVSLYLDCPPGMGLKCPTQDEVTAFRAAVQRGDITWHAFPFNAELELYDPVMVDEGVALTHRIDAEFGLPPKFTLSQRDVPGTTVASIPILRRNGVQAITVGVNTASAYPEVPKIFNWKYPGTGDTLFAMWHPRGYGGYTAAEAVIVPGLTHAMVTDWNGDNAGPYSALEYQKHFLDIQKEFPNAQIVASTFDNFTKLLADYADNIPTLTCEIGDTWIYGCPSDPRKLATMRAFNRAWASYLGSGGQRDAVYLNATRLALKNGEHTWGRDVKSNLKDNDHWANAAFESARVGPNRAQYEILEQSWWEQRAWGIDYAIQALANARHPLLPFVQRELAGLIPQPISPASSGYSPEANHSRVFTTPGYLIRFNSTTGAVDMLQDTRSGKTYAVPGNELFALVYRTYSQADYVQFIHDYMNLTSPPDWALHDFGKPGDNVSLHAFFSTKLLELWTRPGPAGSISFLVRMVITGDAFTNLGGPQDIWLQLDVPASSDAQLTASISVFNKTATRLPEALFLQFNPVGGARGGWYAQKLGGKVDLSTVVDGGSKHMHGIDTTLTYTHPDHSLTVRSYDAGIINVGVPDALPTPVDHAPDTSVGAGLVLWDNLWGTNYVMWWPYRRDGADVPGEENAIFRMELILS
eukprot:m.89006 g.89006  ORF g.89006 m.89006 type:complete len:722 (-) comp13639_c1_seq3:776-2941(-)